jgi:outer membrane protein assembly factor BamA
VNSWRRLGMVVVTTLLATRPLHAQKEPAGEETVEPLSELEQSIAEQALAEHGFEIDPAPEGKRVESIRMVRLEVFDERDPVPDFINVFHVTSQPYVIRRELLFHEGEPYDAVKFAESARNLRATSQLSVVLVLAVRGSTEDSVRVLVITKDIWSLRLNWDVKLTNSQIASLILNPTEQNLFGTHTSIGLRFRLVPDTYSLAKTGLSKRGGSFMRGCARRIWTSPKPSRSGANS